MTCFPTTCCGMAGYFGYEKGEHYSVFVKAGELLLLSTVRDADNEIIIITDGFSCREQIEQQTNRKGMHLAQVIQMGLHEQKSEKTGALPEKKYVDGKTLKNPKRKRRLMAVLGIIAAGVITYTLIRSKKH